MVRRLSDFNDAAAASFGLYSDAGLLHRTFQDQAIDGRSLSLDGRQMVHMGSCSYLGLEQDPRLIEGAIAATRNYGTQFSASRGFISLPLYAELESLLESIVGGPVLVTPTTTLGHASVLPHLIDEDAIVFHDQQVHASVQAGLNHVRVHGIRCKPIRHNRLDLLETELAALSPNQQVWYLIDGLYSMFGDLAPYAELAELLERHPNLYLYIDDAHSISILGARGRGLALDWFIDHPRVVVAGSMAKGFGSTGGFVVLKDEALRRRVRHLGGGLVFSGPLTPPSLGASIASARIHLSPEFHTLQTELQRLIAWTTQECRRLGLPLTSSAPTAVRFIGLGNDNLTRRVGRMLQEAGFFANPIGFPVVPPTQSGVRFTLTRHLSITDVTAFLEAFRTALDIALVLEGLTMADVREAFSFLEDLPGAKENAPLLSAQRSDEAEPEPALRVETADSISAIPAAEWDARFGTRGTFNHQGLLDLERVFSAEQPRPENRWRFRYYTVKDASGKVVAQAFFTLALGKDDMLSPAAVSRLVEAERAADPYHMTTMVYSLGSNMTTGEHWYLDRQGPWRAALRALLRAAQADRRAFEAPMMLLRDLPAGDAELDVFLREEGYLRFPMPMSANVEVRWEADTESYLAALTRQPRKHQRRAVLPFAELFTRKRYTSADLDSLPEAFWDRLYSLYDGLRQRKFDFNSFQLPSDMFQKLLASPEWEILALYPTFEPAPLPVAFALSFVGAEQYVPHIGGHDASYLEHGVYRQLMWHSIMRGTELGKKRVHLGFDAIFEKTRFGATPCEDVFYAQTDDVYRLELLAEKFTEATRWVPRA